jgi:hypothetical protein
MSRTLTTAVDNALQGGNVPYMMLIQLDFASGTLRLCSAAYNFSWNGYTWTGAGNLASIQAIEEGAELQMYGVQMTLSAIPAALVSNALNQTYRGRSALIYLAPLDSSYNVLADPVVAFSGRMDQMQIEIGQTATITLSAESRLTDWERPRIRRYNSEDQQAAYPGDLGFQFVPQMVEKQITWGQ